MRKNSFTNLLFNRDFLKIWWSHLFSLLSANTLNFVLIGHVFSATQSTVAVGLLFFFFLLPTIILGPFSGVLIDNWNKRKIFILSNLSQAVIILLYLGVGDRIWPLYTLIFIYSLCDEFVNPGVGASLPEVVKKRDLPAANSLTFFSMQGTVVIGSILGGLILKILGRLDFFFLGTSLVLLIAAGLAFLLPKEPLKGSKRLRFDFSDPSDLGRVFGLPELWFQAKEGYLFIRNEPLVLVPILLLSGLQSFLIMGLVILPSFAEMVGISFADSSYLIITPIILGAVLGGLFVGRKAEEMRKNRLILAGLYLMGVILLLSPFLNLFLSRPIFLATPLVFGLGFGYILIYVPLQTLIQEHTPFDVRGRVIAVLNTVVTLTSVLPILLTATLVDFIGLESVLVGVGFLFFLLASFAQRKKAMIFNDVLAK